MDTPGRVALVLGSGGARGYAHIGVIEVLEEWGIDVVGVAGTSMGALVGGLHAAGRLDGFAEWARTLRRYDVLRLVDASLAAPGVIRAERVMARVRELVEDAQIEELPIPFTAVATDLLARRPVWFQRGPLDAAIRASIAIPGVFIPVVLNGRLLVDGGLMDPVPISPVASVRADAVIAVDLGGERGELHGFTPAPETAAPRPFDEWADRLRQGAAQLLDRDSTRAWLGRLDALAGANGELRPDAVVGPTADADGAAVVDEAGPEAEEAARERAEQEHLPAGLGKFDVMSQSLEAMQALVTRFRLAGHPPDLVVTVPFGACGTLDFHRASEMIELGRTVTEDALTGAGMSPIERGA